jgi:hypothetical protein
MIVPPLDAHGDADASQPLAKWSTIGNFSHQVDCTTMLASQQQNIQAQLGPITRSANPVPGNGGQDYERSRYP